MRLTELFKVVENGTRLTIWGDIQINESIMVFDNCRDRYSSSEYLARFSIVKIIADNANDLQIIVKEVEE